MSLYNERTRHCTMDDVAISAEARTAAALYWLGAWLDFDPDTIGHGLDVEIEECIPEGNTNIMLASDIQDELRSDYRNSPEACLSWLTAVTADRRKKERAK